MRNMLLFLSLFLVPSFCFGNAEVPSPNMSMPIPTVGVTTGPSYANDINASLLILDKHNHSPGQGVPITPSGINISSDLGFNSNNATVLRSTRFSPQLTPIAGPSDVGALYESGVDLYYNDGSGNQVRITQSGGVAGSPGSIANLNSPASASFVAASNTFVWQSGANIAGSMDFATAILRYPGSYPTPAGNYIALEAPSGLSTGYAITFPLTLPGASSFVTMSSGGILSTPIATANGITRSNLAAVGQQISSSSGSFNTTSGSYVDVTNLTITLTTSGRPVYLFLIPDGSSVASSIQVSTVNVGGNNGVVIKILRDGSDISIASMNSSPANSGAFVLPPGVVSFLDPVGAGTHTYKIQTFVFPGGTSSVAFASMKLAAYEL